MKTRMPNEWKMKIKASKVSHSRLSSIYGIEHSRFENIFYGLVYIRDDEHEIFEEIISDIENGRIKHCPVQRKIAPRKSVVAKPQNRVTAIICGVCEKPFKPYGGDLIPICKRCFEMKDAIRKRMILLKQGKLPKKPQRRSALYWEYQ